MTVWLVRAGVAGLLAAAGAGLTLASHGSGREGETTLLAPVAFDAYLTGWQRVGAAEFSADASARYEGAVAARIRIAPGAELSYQQIRWETGKDILSGDELRSVVWVRSEGVDQSPGAYMALEFVAADGSRAGIAHSKSSAENGAKGWERLEASGAVPKGTASVRLSLILHAHGTAWFARPSLVRTSRETPWPDLGHRVRDLTVDAGRPSTTRFAGVGFHAFHHIFPATDEDLNEVVYKRWREMDPAFVRLNDNWDYDDTMRERIASHIARMKATGTEVYLTSWNPPDVKGAEEMAAWARRVADNLEFYVRRKGLTNVRTYCMSNELSLSGWGRMVGDLPRFRDYHRALFDELKRRDLEVGLLATDASPVDYWHTIGWAAENMDEITAVYGGHHYFNERGPDDERFYPWFAGKLDGATAIARARKKPFIVGEFGAKQDQRTLDGVRQDRCIYFETPDEPLVTLQLAEAVIGAIGAGVYGMGYWTFMDLPDDFAPGYINKWGTFRCSGTDRSTRAIYYGYALLTRYFRGPATAYRVATDDPRLRAAALKHDGTGAWSIAVVNRNTRPTPVNLKIAGGPSAAFRKYVYDPKAVRHNAFGDLPGPSGIVRMNGGKMSDRVPPMSLVVYATAYDPDPPTRVTGVHVKQAERGVRVEWQPGKERDLCYYRVYRLGATGPRQIRSTIATSILDREGSADAKYRVTAVDGSGNEGP